MTNKFRSGVAVPASSAANPLHLTADLAEIPRGDGSAFSQLSQAAVKIGKVFDDVADDAAKAEGKIAGAQAGLSDDFKPLRRHTLRGDAYDKAGIESYSNRLDTWLRDDMQKAIDAAGGDPAKLKSNLDAVHDEYSGQHVFDEVRPAFESKFLRIALPAARAVQSAHDQRLLAEAKASFEQNTATQKATIARSATAVGISKDADEAVAEQLGEFAGLLSRGVAAGHIEQPIAHGVVADVAGNAARAAVTGMFNRLPDLDAQEDFVGRFEQATKGIADSYPGLDKEVLPQLREELVTRFNRSVQAARDIENSADSVARADLEDAGAGLLKAGQLTPDWADANAARLGPRAEDFRNAAMSTAERSTPATNAALLRQAVDDPAGAARDAVSAVGLGDLSRTDFAAIHDYALVVKDDQAKRPWLNDVRRNLASRTLPADDQGGEHAAILGLALPSFEGWLAKNPDATQADAAKAADDIAGQFVASAVASARQSLPLPRFAQVARNEMTPAALPSIAQRLNAAHDAGEVDDDMLIAQSELLDQWKAVLERHSGRGK